MSEWRAIPGWEQYEVSDRGEIRRTKDGVPISLIDTNGYRSAVLYKRRWDYVHRMMLEAFTGPAPDGKPHCGHVNGDPADNRLENLRWVSEKENGEDMVMHGRSTYGTRNPSAKLDDDKVRLIRKSLEGNRGIGERFGVSERTVRDIRAGITWRHVK